LLALALVPFAPTLVELVAYWGNNPEYSHGFLMPFVAGWLLWRDRAKFARLESRPSYVGVALLLPCLAVLLLGEMKLSWFLKPFAFVGALGALTWGALGPRAVRLALPTFVTLALMCPLPARIQELLLLPLKRSAALLATGLLDLAGVPATLEGNLIQLPGIADLWVADACSGIRSLVALVTLAILAALLWPRRPLFHAIVVVSAVPIAVLVNGLRIWVTGMIAVHAGLAAAEGFFHFFEGLALLAVGALHLWGWSTLVGRLLPERP
jgi:exosortase